MKKVVLYFTFIAVLSSCSQIIVPYHTTVDKITSVKPGMSKQNVVTTLGIDPYEIYHGIEAGCEIHHFKYKHKEKYFGTLNSFGNVGGVDRYVKPSNLYVYYRDGKMESLVTDNGKDSSPGILSFMDELDFECNGGPKPVYGCMDKDALNYNFQATAQRDGEVIENGSTLMIGDCEYCACDYMVNIDYDSKKNCGEKCIPIPKEELEEEEVITHFDPDCTLCDLAEKENAQINVNIDFDNEEPKYNGYISKLFRNQINFKNKVSKNMKSNNKMKSTKKKKHRTKNHTINESSGLSVGLVFLGGLGPKISKNSKLSNNITLSNSVVYLLESKTVDYGDVDEFGLYNSFFTPSLMTSNGILFNLISSNNYSFKAGLGAGIAIGELVSYGADINTSSKLKIEPLSLSFSHQFKRFELSGTLPVIKLNNYLSPGFLGINFNF